MVRSHIALLLRPLFQLSRLFTYPDRVQDNCCGRSKIVDLCTRREFHGLQELTKYGVGGGGEHMLSALISNPSSTIHLPTLGGLNKKIRTKSGRGTTSFCTLDPPSRSLHNVRTPSASISGILVGIIPVCA